MNSPLFSLMAKAQIIKFSPMVVGAKRRPTTRRTTAAKRVRATKTVTPMLLSPKLSPKRLRIATKTINRRRRRKQYATLNVKGDVTKYTSTYYKKKVTSTQQKKINRRFKNENNPFIYKAEFPNIDTTPQTTDTCKWFWQCHNGWDYVNSCWKSFINPTSGKTSDNLLDSTTGNVQYAFNQEQAIYFHTFKSKYEILNPTNYDMHVDIYDIVCKKDTYGSVVSRTLSVHDKNDPSDMVNFPQSNAKSDPIQMMLKGLNPSQYGLSNYNLQDPSNMDLFDLQMAPTKSYPFNIYWKIVGKKRVTLQPGASMYHTFTHKPKCLLQRGYWAYKFQTQTHSGDNGIEDITSGTLFKVWGQLSGDTSSSATAIGENVSYITQDNSKAVVNLSGRLALKCFYTARHYCMQPKATYMFKNIDYNKWVPADEENLVVVNPDVIRYPQDDIANDFSPSD